MTASRREAGEPLTILLDSMQADLEARAKPFAEALELRAERDRARRWAVDIEQQNAMLEQIITDAQAWLADEPCTCRWFQTWDGKPDVESCSRCIALSYLAPRPTDSSAFLLMGGE